MENELEMENDDKVEQESEVWGWESFLQDISIFLLMRQYSTANENFSHYAGERLTLCVQSLLDLHVSEHLHRQNK